MLTKKSERIGTCELNEVQDVSRRRNKKPINLKRKSKKFDYSKNCYFGKSCTRKNCPFKHPEGQAVNKNRKKQKKKYDYSNNCFFGSKCTRRNCPF